MAPTNQSQEDFLHVSLLGEFRITFGKTAVSITSPRHQSLLAYLILNRDKIHTRQQLAFLLWPDSTGTQALTNLRQTLFYLRQDIPGFTDIFQVERRTICWLADAPVQADVIAFETAVSQTQPPIATDSQKQQLIQAIASYQGDFLPDHYDDWVLAAREQLRQQYLYCLETLIHLLEAEPDVATAITYAQQLLAADPLHEEAYRRLMRLQAQNGHIATAIRTYHTCATILENELGVSPSLATQAVYEKLLQTTLPKVTPIPAQTPLVAREKAWYALQTAWQQARQGDPQFVLLQGEAGIGKTRLAEELRQWVARQRVMTLTSSCYAAQRRLPYAPITAWLRSDAIQKSLNRLDDRWLIELARLLPELLTKRPFLPQPDPLTEGWQQQHFFTALAQALLQASPPLLLFIDDLQWCDRDTLDWLQFLLHFDPHARFLLLGTVRSEEVDNTHPLHHWQHDLERNGRLHNIPLTRLNAASTQELAEQIVGDKLDSSQAEWLYTETEGIPLFVVEMARAALAQTESHPPHAISPLPEKMRAVLTMRLAQLSPSARELCDLAAVIGRSFTVDLLAAACDQDEEQLVTGLDELWHRRIVREQQGLAYDFSHDKLRQTAYAGLSEVRRRLLHRRVVDALSAGRSGSVDEVAHQMAAHYEEMGNYEAAITHYRRAAAVAARVYAHRETLEHLQCALALFSQIPADGELWVELIEQQASVLALMGEYEQARAVLETAVSHAPSKLHQVNLLYQQGDTWLAQQQQAEALVTFDRALALLAEGSGQNEDGWEQSWLEVQLRRSTLFYFTSRLDDLSDLIDQLHEPIAAHGTIDQRRRYLDARNMLVFRQKRYRLDADDVATCQEILTLAEASENSQVVASSQFSVGFGYLWAGEIDLAIVYFEQAQQQAVEGGNVYLQNQIAAYLTQAYRLMGDVKQVRLLVAKHEEIASQAQNPFYSGMLSGQRAWLSVQDGVWETAVSHGNHALAEWGTLPFPLQHIALWPLLAANIAQGKLADAVACASQMLAPMQQQLDEITTTELQQAIDAWEANQPELTQNHLHNALQLSKN